MSEEKTTVIEIDWEDIEGTYEKYYRSMCLYGYCFLKEKSEDDKNE